MDARDKERQREGGEQSQDTPGSRLPILGRLKKMTEKGTPRNCKGSELASHSRNQLPIEISNRNMEVNFLLSYM